MPEYVPSAAGLPHELPDEVIVQVRLHFVDHRYQARSSCYANVIVCIRLLRSQTIRVMLIRMPHRRRCMHGVCYCYSHMHVLPQLEWCLPDRRLVVPDRLDLTKAAARLVEATAKHPGLCMEFEPAAREVFDSCPCACNSHC